ncbi:Pal1-domain-containing protein [Pleurostoma richardsiae]|uniref:Pal1-domain-containing protein n=1 Tax=Pleurostoma richardsiae TaxID=41990 RepID=A0AA38SBP1_9PEZI|nr:Pal1-domain-containing protein [Pleurostoma richardsiae]
MAAIQPDHPDQRSASLTLNLSSNNPFRNRATSPNPFPSQPTSPFDDPNPRPVSRNPFLDPASLSNQPATSQDTMATISGKASPTAEDLFGDLTIEDKTSVRPPPVNRPGAPRGENVPPPGRRPPPNHRPTRSQEEAMRARRMRDGPGESSPQRGKGSRPRRNSESSVADHEKPLTEEERKARDSRRQERERRHRDRKEKPKPSRKMDIIDRLDSTSIFGTGLFHHDGPYDALNSHRNRDGSRRAPMQAFPKDSLNMAIGGAGPLNARPDHATFMGNGDQEAFIDYAAGAAGKAARTKGEAAVFDPLSRGSILHGDESLGLGTSTFLEGTPAARKDIERREQETAQETMENGIQRKKSLAHRIRNINRNGPRDFQPSGRMTNPEGTYGTRRSPPADYPTTSSMGPRYAEPNPFFVEYDPKKGEEQISVRRTGRTSPGSPGRTSYGLERRATHDAVSPTEEQPKQGSGLLARVKSLKGGRKRPSENQPPPPGTAA